MNASSRFRGDNLRYVSRKVVRDERVFEKYGLLVSSWSFATTEDIDKLDQR